MHSVGIFAWFGYDLPLTESFRKIKSVGFESVLLWWGEFAGDLPLLEQPNCAARLGLRVENAHAPFDGCNDLWLPDQDGKGYADRLIQAISGCAATGVPTLVVHLTDGDRPIPCHPIGIERLKPVVEAAVRYGVTLAFENLQQLPHLERVLDTFCDPQVGFCYDSGHHHCCFPTHPFLERYGNRLAALHLHDNDGSKDQHLLPYDGTFCWQNFADRLQQIGYTGDLTLEVQAYHGYEKRMDADTFLEKAYQAVQAIPR